MVKWIQIFIALAITVTTCLASGESSPALMQAKTRAEEVRLHLNECASLFEKNRLLTHNATFLEAMNKFPELGTFVNKAPDEESYVLALLISLGQFDTVFARAQKLQNPQESLHKLASKLVELDRFYQPIGGLLGYHTTVINLMTSSDIAFDAERYLPPPINDIRIKNTTVWNACYDGTEKLGSTATIFALGGAGDRLNLIDGKTGEPLPAACLNFCGKSLFEGLMRDVEAQEYWHYRSFGNQVTVPILIMTSQEKNNDRHIASMGDKANWFGHNKTAIRRMVQPLVPIIDTEGQWAVTGPLEMVLKPGGHGVIWKLAEDSGSVQWLTSQNIDAAVIRQVNNPLAGLDHGLLTFMGHGLANKKSFGFLSCPSRPGYAEGLNALFLNKTPSSAQATISSIEYTQFGTLKNILPNLFKEGVCPANTNILFINLHEIKGALDRNPIPGMIVNAKTNVDVIENGIPVRKVGARLESCMQNIADGLMSPVPLAKLPSIPSEDLSTFLLLQDRSKLMSTAKKAFQPGQSPQETPVSCLYDWHCAMRSLLSSSCQFILPQEQALDDFIHNGPAFIFSFHPAMGPLWDVIGQKLSMGTIAQNSELELEVSEISCKNLNLDGSLRIIAEKVTGDAFGPLGRTFTEKVGRATLNNVQIVNKGVKSLDIASVLNGSVERNESCEIVLKGFSEIVADNVQIYGNFHLVVPDRKKAILRQDSTGKIITTFESIVSPSWQYAVVWQRGSAPKLLYKKTE
jgi:UTP---glucose-1-phosphate uridylyltransferase